MKFKLHNTVAGERILKYCTIKVSKVPALSNHPCKANTGRPSGGPHTLAVNTENCCLSVAYTVNINGPTSYFPPCHLEFNFHWIITIQWG